jgi:hypothetical protein
MAKRHAKPNPTPNFNVVLAAAESLAHEARKGQRGGYTDPGYFAEKLGTIEREVWDS